MTEQEDNKPIPIRNMDRNVYREARLAAVKLGQLIGVWITQAIKERLDRENKS